jgi:steroid 5-alpha reductase family enzyme
MNRALKKFTNRSLVYLPFSLCIALFVLSDTLRTFTFWNGGIQLLLFILVVCIPAYRTKRMSYVDIGWPWGLVCIGLLVLFLGEGYYVNINGLISNKLASVSRNAR